ncbi:MAG: YMGG-like glycine zipper-containing protein, partial [Gemmatimonadota bacterium]
DVELDEDTRQLAERAAIGAAAGAALGAIIGGDLEDILVGGALGAGAGTVISLGLGRVDAELPRGTEMRLRTTREIRLE